MTKEEEAQKARAERLREQIEELKKGDKTPEPKTPRDFVRRAGVPPAVGGRPARRR